MENEYLSNEEYEAREWKARAEAAEGKLQKVQKLALSASPYSGWAADILDVVIGRD